MTARRLRVVRDDAEERPAILDTLDWLMTQAPTERFPRRVAVLSVYPDKSVRAWVDSTLQDVPLDRLERWMRAGVTIEPYGGWKR